MSNSKQVNSRIQQKIDTSENWSKALNFKPLQGEIIIYTDLNRFKVGDGITLVNDLPFFNYCQKGQQYTATPKTLVSIISSAEADATIQLTAGEYPLLELKGKNAYPENLTIVGGNGVNIAGISITSGVLDTEVIKDTDTSNAIMPKGLTLKNLMFSNSLQSENSGLFLRNCSIENLRIETCKFKNNARISILPNSLSNACGHDYENENTIRVVTRSNKQALIVKNLIIKGCELEDITTKDTSAITVIGADGAIIEKNWISNAALNGIRVVGIPENNIFNKGLICVVDNQVNNPSNNLYGDSIYISDALNSEVYISNNSTYKIKVLNCINTTINKSEQSGYVELSNNTIPHEERTDNPHKMTAEQIGAATQKDLKDLKENYCKKKPNYTATPETLVNVIKSAEAGATIQLDAGSYTLLELKGQGAYPENLTIIGKTEEIDIGNGKKQINYLSTIRGISITSGISDETLKYYTSKDNSVLPRGLTLKNLIFSKNISLRNCSIDGLQIESCKFLNGARISLLPNSLSDEYGDDFVDSNNPIFKVRREKLILYMKNLLIKDCQIQDVTGDDVSAILIRGVDGAFIENNWISGVPYNGIQIAGVSGASILNRGIISISNNQIRYTGSRSIRIADSKDAELYVNDNILEKANQTDANSEYIKTSDCISTKQTYNSNRYEADNNDKIDISIGNGITVVDCTMPPASYIVDAGTSNGWTYRKWSNGDAECWKELYGTYTAGVALNITSNLPFPFSEIPIATGVLTQLSLASSTYNLVISCTKNSIYVSVEGSFVSGSSAPHTSSANVSVHVLGRWK